jgi:hypothetical protein
MKRAMKDFNKHASDTITTTLFTVMLWIGVQAIIEEALRHYSPGFERWVVGLIEIILASIGLWYINRKEKRGV